MFVMPFMQFDCPFRTQCWFSQFMSAFYRMIEFVAGFIWKCFTPPSLDANECLWIMLHLEVRLSIWIGTKPLHMVCSLHG